jgi:sialate O-acetylesterase
MLTLHPLLGDAAVLQCEKPLVIRGVAAPLGSVTVRFAGAGDTSTADAGGQWSVQLPAFPPGGPHELVVESGGETQRRSGLVLGEVWLCSGQSNMEWTLGMLKGLEADIAEADDPLLRCFTVARVPSDEPAADITGRWQPATPRNARDFSATAYFFARRLRAATGRPVGLIVSAFGGTVIASWLPKAVLASRSEYEVFASKDTGRNGTENDTASLLPHPYEERAPVAAGWESAGLDESSWGTLPVPGYWQDCGWRHNGAVWYRCTVELSPEWVGRELALELEACDDFDETFVNGTRVGGIGPEAPNAYATRRVYAVPAALVTGRRATIAVRVFDHWGNGGITGGVLLRLATAREETLVLSGRWKAKVEKALPLRAPTGELPPAVLYNGMIHPLVGCGLRGFLWYQGESDAPRAALYRMLLPDLIATWRSLWGDPLLPFGIVQLANYQATSPEPVENDWAELRDAQLLAARTMADTGLAVTIDVGEAGDIHPGKKRPVGERLARWALATVHGRPEVPWSSPLAADHWSDSEALHVRFTHAGDGLRARDGGPLQGFQIAGADRRWRWAEATIVQRDIVRVHAAKVKDPVAVRYAWQANPLCTLENSAGLPASPFRTDDWRLTTLR